MSRPLTIFAMKEIFGQKTSSRKAHFFVKSGNLTHKVNHSLSQTALDFIFGTKELRSQSLQSECQRFPDLSSAGCFRVRISICAKTHTTWDKLESLKSGAMIGLFSVCCFSCPTAGSQGRRRAGWTGSPCWRWWPACRWIKLCPCCRLRCLIASSALRVSAGSAGALVLSSDLGNTGQPPGASYWNLGSAPLRAANNS